jgi:hypothetical protein
MRPAPGIVNDTPAVSAGGGRRARDTTLADVVHQTYVPM